MEIKQKLARGEACRWPVAERGKVMPFKNQAQRRKFAELLLKGEISSKTFEEWNRETGSARLPEHVRAKAKRKSKDKKAKPKRKIKRTKGKRR